MLKERELRRYIESEGGKVLGVKKGKHWQVTADFEGVKLQVVVAGTNSDRRALLNNRAWIRRQVSLAKGNVKS